VGKGEEKVISGDTPSFLGRTAGAASPAHSLFSTEPACVHGDRSWRACRTMSGEKPLTPSAGSGQDLSLSKGECGSISDLLTQAHTLCARARHAVPLRLLYYHCNRCQSSRDIYPVPDGLGLPGRGEGRKSNGCAASRYSLELHCHQGKGGVFGGPQGSGSVINPACGVVSAGLQHFLQRRASSDGQCL